MTAVIPFVNAIFLGYSALIVLRVIASWVAWRPSSRTGRRAHDMLVEVTDVVLRPLRRVVPTLGPLDISPIVAILGVSVANQFVVWALS